MLHLDNGVGHQGDFLLEGVLVLGQHLCVLAVLIILTVFVVLTVLVASLVTGSLRPAPCGWFLVVFLLRCLLEVLVGLLQEGYVIIERLHVDGSVDRHVAVVLNGVTQRRAVVHLGAAQPGVGGVVLSIELHPVEEGQFVDGHLIAGGERLPVVERCAPVAHALPHAVFPSLIVVSIEVFVDGRIGFLNFSVGSTLEVHVQVLRQIPAQGEIAVPKELLAEGQRQVGVFGVL